MQLDFGDATASAALAARDRLSQLARGTNLDEPRMAKLARSAIFAEAMLGAVRAQLNELRGVAK